MALGSGEPLPLIMLNYDTRAENCAKNTHSVIRDFLMRIAPVFYVDFFFDMCLEVLKPKEYQDYRN